MRFKTKVEGGILYHPPFLENFFFSFLSRRLQRATCKSFQTAELVIQLFYNCSSFLERPLDKHTCHSAFGSCNHHSDAWLPSHIYDSHSISQSRLPFAIFPTSDKQSVTAKLNLAETILLVHPCHTLREEGGWNALLDTI